MFTFLCMNEYVISKAFIYYHNVLWTHMFDSKTWKISINNNMIQILQFWLPEVIHQSPLGAKAMQQNIVTITAKK